MSTTVCCKRPLEDPTVKLSDGSVRASASLIGRTARQPTQHWRGNEHGGPLSILACQLYQGALGGPGNTICAMKVWYTNVSLSTMHALNAQAQAVANLADGLTDELDPPRAEHPLVAMKS